MFRYMYMYIATYLFGWSLLNYFCDLIDYASLLLINSFHLNIFPGFKKNTSWEEAVFVIGATNCPWSIDHAIRRRLDKRVYVGLPTGGYYNFYNYSYLLFYLNQIYM